MTDDDASYGSAYDGTAFDDDSDDVFLADPLTHFVSSSHDDDASWSVDFVSSSNADDDERWLA